MSNKSQMTYTSQNIRNSKFLLITGMAVAVVIDALITALLIIGGYSFMYIAFPAALLIVDAVYLIVGTTATNYRFKYSLAVWLLYVLFTCVLCIAGTIILVMAEGTVLTNVALILWAVVHAVSVICAIITALYTSKKLTSAVFTVIVTLLFSAACVLYAAFLFSKGFFGQGYGLRTLVYDYDTENDCYTVSGVLSGNSQRVEIADTFNGKPVKAIDCKVLCEENVKEYVLHDNFELVGTQALAEGEFDGKSIQVKSENAPLFRAQLFNSAKTLQNRTNALKLANATVPYALEEGKGYIAFNYDKAAYNACNGNVIPLIIGDKGQRVSLDDYASDYEYLTHSDKTSVADLKWSYENCNGYILDSISSGISYVLGDSANVDVYFENVYLVYVQSGNDSKYDLREKQSSFCQDSLNGTALDYRYVAKSQANNFFNNFTKREGFTLEWRYGKYGMVTDQTFSNLADVFEQINYSKVSIYPKWTLNDPTVELQSNYSITYGENVTFTSKATSPVAGVSIVYRWEHNGKNVGTSKDLNLTTPSLSGEYDGEYVLTVTADGGELTSLTSSATKKLNLAIDKKTISFGWTMPGEGDRVYSGTEKTVTATFDNSQLVGGDSLEYKLSGYTTKTANFTNAGDYAFSVEIYGTYANNYQVDGSGSNSLTITPLPVEVSWSDYDLTYNGLEQTPSASAFGVGKDSAKQLATVTGGQKNAGSYTATANCSDSNNYTFTNSTLNYTIAKVPLTVTANNCTLAYGVPYTDNGAVFSGFVNGETASDLGGELSYFFANSYDDVGVYSGCVKISGLSSDNYQINYVHGDLEITPRAIVVTWRNATNLVYDGQKQDVWPGISNRVYGDDVLAVFTGGDAIDAGSYTAIVTGLSGKDAGNYKIIETISTDYTIEKEKVTISPISYSVTYGDAEVQLYANVEGTIYNDDFTYQLNKVAGNDVNIYAITVSITGETKNYDISTNQGTYTITPKTVTITWNVPSDLVYNGSAKTVTADIGNVIEGDEVSAVVDNGNKTNAGSYTATATLYGSKAGNYTIKSSDNSLNYTISPAQVTLKANNATSVYGQPIAELTVDVSGTIYNNELVWSVNTSANSSSSAGSYDIVIDVVTNTNYSVTTINATYTISLATPVLEGVTGGVYTISEEVDFGTTLGELTEKLPAQTFSGSWIWEAGNTATVGEVGTNTFNVYFIPTDTVNYNSVVVKVTVTVR